MSEVHLWEAGSEVLCTQVPPWSVDPEGIEHWVRLDFPVCLPDFDYTPPASYTRVTADPPDLNWYDCFCLSFNQIRKKGFTMLSCGSATGRATAQSPDGHILYDSTKNWKPDKLKGTVIVNITQGTSGYVQWNDESSLGATSDAEGLLEPLHWNWNETMSDYYEMSLPQDISFKIEPADSEDCCSQSYNVEYDFVMPCLPQNMTAATKLWYRYVMNCTRSAGDPPVQLTQEECSQLWESSYRGMCSQDTVKFWNTYKYLDSTIHSIGIGDAVTLVKPTSFADRKMMQSYSGAADLSVVKPNESVNVDLDPGHPTSNQISWDVSGELGYPKPVPFEVVGIYPEPDSVISTAQLTALVTVRFNDFSDIANLEVIAYYEDVPGGNLEVTPIAPVADPSSPDATNYRFYEVEGPEFAAPGSSRTLVVKAYWQTATSYIIYSSTVSATYTRGNPSAVVFENIEPASGEYASTGALVYACELNTDVISVDLIGAPVSTVCTPVPGTTKWYWPGAGTVPSSSYFQAVRDGAVYRSESITVATGGAQPQTSAILGEILQQIPGTVTSVAAGELVLVHARSNLTNSTLVRSGKTDTETFYARYTGGYFDITVFESAEFSYGVNKFFSVIHGGVFSASGNIIIVELASGGESASSLAGRAIVLLDASDKEIGRYTIVESDIVAGDWSITVSANGNLPSAATQAKIEPNRSFPATVATTSGNGAGHTGTTTNSFTLSYDPSSSYPTSTSACVDRLYATRPVLSDVSMFSRLPTPELTVVGPEVASASIVDNTADLSDEEALKSLGTDMEAGVAGVFTGQMKIVAKDVPEADDGDSKEFLLNTTVGSFTVSRRITAIHDIGADDPDIHFLYPHGTDGDFVFNVPSIPVHYWYYGYPISEYDQHSIAKLYLNEATLKFHSAGSLEEPRIQYVESGGKHYLDLYINSSQIKWSDPFVSENSYVDKNLVLDYEDTVGKRLTIVSNEICRIGDSSAKYLRIQVSEDPSTGILGSFPKTVTQFMVVGSGFMDTGETQVPSRPTKVYARWTHTKHRYIGGVLHYEANEGLKAPDVGQPALQYVWDKVCEDIPWLNPIDDSKDVMGLVQNAIKVEDENHHIGLYVEASGVGTDDWKYKTLTLLRTDPAESAGEIGIYQIISNTLSSSPGGGSPQVVTCILNTSSIPAPLANENRYSAVIGVRDAFAQCMLSVVGFNGVSATYRIIHNTGIPDTDTDTMTFTLDSRTYPTGIISDTDNDSLYGAALEVSGDITGATLNGLEVAYDSRWSLPFFENAPMLVTWQLDNECDDFYLVREQTTRALADDNASYVDCGGECEFDVTISGQSFKCDFGMKVIGRSVNVPGCGGGGMFSEIYISCPWAKHIHCDRPTAPCNCVFVLSYLLVIPLGSVLL